MRRTADGWEPDELLMDERWLARECRRQGARGFLGLLACRDRQRVQARACGLSGHPDPCRDGRAASLRAERGGHPADRRGAGRVRHHDHRGRPLHRLARDDGARECVRRRARPDGGRQAVHVLERLALRRAAHHRRARALRHQSGLAGGPLFNTLSSAPARLSRLRTVAGRPVAPNAVRLPIIADVEPLAQPDAPRAPDVTPDSPGTWADRRDCSQAA